MATSRGTAILLAVLCLSGCGKKDASDKSEKTAPAKAGGTAIPSEPAGVAGSPGSKKTAAHNGAVEPEPQKLDFVDVAKTVGVPFEYFADIVPGRYMLVESMGGTLAWFDYDGDGHQDLYLPNGNRLAKGSDDIQNQLYRNVGGSFERVEDSGSGDTGYGFGAAIGDFDLDGFPDVFVANYGANVLLKNNGDGTFTNTTPTVLANTDWGTGCVWFDANADGLLDLFVMNYGELTLETIKICQHKGQPGYCGPSSLPGQTDRLYVNNGDGSFKDATTELGFDVDPMFSLGVVVADFDNDTQPEVVVARDLKPNAFFVKGADGVWSDQAVSAGVAASADGKFEAGMGVACADFDGDEKFDFMLTHYYEAKNTMYRNLGDFTFSDDSYRSRIAATSLEFLGFGTSVLDVNRDGAPDLFVANGHVLGPNHDPNEMTCQILLNNGKGRFSDVSDRCGPFFTRRLLGRGSATGDFDNDGDSDIGVVHIDQPFVLLEDRMPTPNWIGLEVVGADRQGTAGGYVLVECGDLRRKLPLKSGGSYLSVSDPRLRVALPAGSDDVNVKVVYPGGGMNALKALSRNQYWRVTPDTAEPCVW